MAHQLTVNPPSSVECREEEEEEEEEEEKHETKAFFFQYMSRRAEKDEHLNGEGAEVIKRQRGTIVSTSSGCAAAVDVASRLADLGDEIDTHYQEEMKEIIELTGSPETAFSMFTDIVKNLFEWNERGEANISVGRISALMAYCYHLLKTYITDKMASSGLIISFMGLVATWLFKFFIKAKFYQWLRNQGGWGRLVMDATSNVTNLGRNVYLVVGVASLAVWAISYFRGT